MDYFVLPLAVPLDLHLQYSSIPGYNTFDEPSVEPRSYDVGHKTKYWNETQNIFCL